MATIYSSGYNSAYVAVPSAKIAKGEFNGDIKCAFASYTLLADATSGDVLKLFKLPKGARVLDFKVNCPDLGSTGVMDFGWAAAVELDSAGVTLEAADADGFIVDQDVSGQASIGIPVAGVPGLHKQFAGEVDAQLLLPTTSSATGLIIQVHVSFVVV